MWRDLRSYMALPFNHISLLKLPMAFRSHKFSNLQYHINVIINKSAPLKIIFCENIYTSFIIFLQILHSSLFVDGDIYLRLKNGAPISRCGGAINFFMLRIFLNFCSNNVTNLMNYS